MSQNNHDSRADIMIQNIVTYYLDTVKGDSDTHTARPRGAYWYFLACELLNIQVINPYTLLINKYTYHCFKPSY